MRERISLLVFPLVVVLVSGGRTRMILFQIAKVRTKVKKVKVSEVWWAGLPMSTFITFPRPGPSMVGLRQ